MIELSPSLTQCVLRSFTGPAYIIVSGTNSGEGAVIVSLLALFSPKKILLPLLRCHWTVVALLLCDWSIPVFCSVIGSFSSIVVW